MNSRATEPDRAATDPHPPLTDLVAPRVTDYERPDPPPGYRLDRLLGSGGQAQVWAARSEPLDLPVALKFWPPDLHEHDRGRIRREIEVLRRLAGHNNIVRLLDAETRPDAAPWLATELCDTSLAATLRSGSIPVADAFRFADDILTGLAAVHQIGHLHRDVKPANVLLHQGQAKLCDLGLVGQIDHYTRMHFSGTAYFLAPELRTCQPTVASDLYAAGRTLEALFEVAYGASSVPPALERLLTRATSARPHDRPADAEAFRQAVASSRFADDGAGPTKTWPDGAGTGRRPGRRLVTIAAVTVLALGVVALGVAVRTVAEDRRPVSAASAMPTVPATSAAPSAPPASAPTASATPSRLATSAAATRSAAPRPAAVAAPSSAPQQIQSLFASRCVDVRGPDTRDGTPLQLWDCINAPEERWVWDGARLRGFGDKCISLPDDAAHDGTPVQLSTCTDEPRQRWRLGPSGELRGLHDKCLDVRGPEEGNGTPLQIWTCVDVPQQQWRLF
jgi:serine/threonine protein kinase